MGWANRSWPEAELGDEVLAMAQRIAQVPPDIVQINKRTVHRGMEVMGLRAAIRAGTELAALATHSKTLREFTKDIVDHGVTGSLTKRDSPFGDYRTSERKDA
jgi:enoyl-CoA hydratase